MARRSRHRDNRFVSHNVELLISRPVTLYRARDLLRSVVTPSSAVQVCPLELGFATLPVTRPVLEGIKKYVGMGLVPKVSGAKRLYFGAGWRYDDQSIHVLGRWLSLDGPVAYVETNYFGGSGDQGAVVWARHQRVFGPARAEENVIHEALALLGDEVRSSADRFEALGLGSRRSSDGFARAGAELL